MSNLLLSAAAVLLGGLPIESGYLSQYDPGLMWATALQQQEWGRLPADLSIYDGFIATADCHIGREGWLSIEGGEWLFVAAADCSGHQSTTRWMKDNGIIAELSFNLAAQHDIVGQGGVTGRIAWLN